MPRNAKLLWFLACALTLELPAMADTGQAFHRDLDFFFEQIDSGYAALGTKREGGLELDAFRRQTFAELANVESTANFHRLLQRTIATFHDSHFYSHVAEDRVSYLGFESDFAQGRVVVTSIASRLPAARLLRVGDEIVSFNGKPVADELSTIAAYIGKSSPTAVQRYAAMMLGRRYGKVLPLKKGIAHLVVERAGEPDVEIELTWQQSTTKEIPHPYHDKWRSPIGVPDGVSEIDAPSTAYVAMMKTGTRVGFLRIPDFMVDGQTYKQQLDSYAKALDNLEQQSDVLILDITFNDGGNVEYGATILALLMDDEFPSYRYRFLATAAELEVWSKISSNESISAVERRQVRGVADAIRGAMLQEERLTKSVAFVGDHQTGHGRYTKPILLLVNEFTASAADIFAVYMRDTGRATLVGQSTMGAGSKSRRLVLPESGIEVRMPRVLFCRPDGAVIENVGASPHVRYDIQIEDLISDYSKLRQFAFRSAKSLVDREKDSP